VRILFVTPNFPTALDRTRGIWNYETARVLARRHEVVVIAHISWVDEVRSLGCGRMIERAIHEAGMEIHYPRYYYTPRLMRPHYGWFLWQSIRPTLERVLSRFTPDVVLAGWVHPDGECALRIATLTGAACVIRVGGSDILVLPKHRERRFRVIEVLSRADAVVCVSHHLTQAALALGAPASRIHLVHNGLSLDRFCPDSREAARRRLGLPVNEMILLWVGNMVPIKGLEVLLDACAIWRRDGLGAGLWLIGDGPLERTLRQQAASRQLTHAVTFVGRVPHDALPDWYRSADLTVLPSRSEGIPNVLYESIACGTPFVASDVGGVSEVADPRLDRLVPPGAPRLLASAVRDVLSSPATGERRLMPWTWEEQGQAIESVFGDVAAARGRAAGDKGMSL
jgi:glycosyltransferase involved in cell wall biosynthesis